MVLPVRLLLPTRDGFYLAVGEREVFVPSEARYESKKLVGQDVEIDYMAYVIERGGGTGGPKKTAGWVNDENIKESVFKFFEEKYAIKSHPNYIWRLKSRTLG